MNKNTNMRKMKLALVLVFSILFSLFMLTDVSAFVDRNVTIADKYPYLPGDENLTTEYNIEGATSYSVNILRNGSSITNAYYPMEGGSSVGNRDFSGNGNDLTVSNAVYNPTGGYDGNGSYDFDGSGDSLDVGNGIIGTNEFTISFWYRADVVDAAGGTLFDMGAADKYFFGGYNNGEMRLWFESNNDADVQITYGTAPTAGQWYHYVGVGRWNDNSHQLYIDGTQVGSSTVATDGKAGAFAANMEIGEAIGPINPYADHEGSIDDFRVYDYALTAAQIRAIYENRSIIVETETTENNETWAINVTGFNSSGIIRNEISNTVTIDGFTDIAGCQTLDANNKYRISADFSGTTDCFPMGGNNIVLYCAGNRIDGDGGDEAIIIDNDDDISAYDCEIYDYNEGFRISLTNNFFAKDLDIRIDQYGFRDNDGATVASSITDGILENITVQERLNGAAIANDGFILGNLSNVTFKDIKVHDAGNGGNGDFGINVLYGLRNVTFDNIYINSSSGDGMRIEDGNDQVILRNVIINGTDNTNAEGINMVDFVRNSVVDNITLLNTGDDGLEINQVNNSNFTNIYVNESRLRGIFCDDDGIFNGCSNSRFENITINGTTTNDGIYIEQGSNNVINNVSIYNIGDSGDQGIQLVGINSSNISNIYTNNTVGDGIILQNNNYYNRIENITINNTGDDGLEINNNGFGSYVNNVSIYRTFDMGFMCEDQNVIGCPQSNISNIIIDTTRDDGFWFERSNNSRVSNVTIRNIGIGNTNDFATSIRSGYSVFENFTITNISAEMRVQTYADSNVFDGITIRNSSRYGLFITTDADRNRFYNLDFKNLSLSGILTQTRSEGNHFENITINSTLLGTPANNRGFSLTDNDNTSIKNATIDRMGDVGILVQSSNVVIDNIRITNTGDDAIYQQNSRSNLSITNTFIQNSSSYGIFVDGTNSNFGAKFENITISDTIEGGFRHDTGSFVEFNNISVYDTLSGTLEGIYFNAVTDSNFTNIFANNSGAQGIEFLTSHRANITNMTSMYSTQENIYFNDNDDSNMTNVTTRFGTIEGIEIVNSANTNSTKIDSRNNGGTNLIITNAASSSQMFALSRFTNSSNISSNAWASIVSDWNLTTEDIPLGNYWDDLVCTSYRGTVYKGERYYSCTTEDYTVEVANSRIDFGPLVELSAVDNNTNVSFVNQTPSTGSFLCPGTPININVSSAGSLERSTYLDINDSMKAYINFENVSGATVFDYTRFDNDGTITGANVTDSDRRRGTYAEFDGVNDVVNLGNSSEFDITNNITIMGWAKMKGQSTVDYPRIISKGQSTTTNGGYGIWVSDPDQTSIGCRIWDGSSIRDVTLTSGVENDNQWHHYACTYNGSVMRLYVDGAIVSNLTASFNIGSVTNDLTIGDANSQRPFNGSIDEVQVHNRALQMEEVRAAYHANVNSLDLNLTRLPEGFFNITAITNNYNGNVTNTTTRNFSLNLGSGAVITINTPNLIEDTNVNLTANITSDRIIKNVSYIIDGNPASRVIMSTADNLSWFADINDTLFDQGDYNISYSYFGSCDYEEFENRTFTIRGGGNTSIEKNMVNVGNNIYLVTLNLTNTGTNSLDVIVTDFVDQDFTYGSFSPSFDFVNFTYGPTYDGALIGWNLTVPNQTTVLLNYSVTGLGDYEVMRTYPVGLG